MPLAAYIPLGARAGKKAQDLPAATQKRPDFLASCENTAIYRAISHGNMAHKAVRWQPGR